MKPKLRSIAFIGVVVACLATNFMARGHMEPGLRLSAIDSLTSTLIICASFLAVIFWKKK